MEDQAQDLSTEITPDDPSPAPAAQVTEEAPAPESKPEPESKADPEEKPEPKLSRREKIEKSLEKLEKGEEETKDKEPAPAEKKEAKAENGAVRTAKPQQAADDASSSEDDKSSPPARIADDAKKFWRSTPRVMKAEFQRLENEHRAAIEKSQAATAVYDEIREYDNMARQNGTTVKQALDRYVEVDRKLIQDFGQGVAHIAKMQNKSPVEAIASVLQAYGLTPQKYAQHVAQNPQAHHVQPAARPDPMVQQVAAQTQAIMQRLEQQEQAQRIAPIQQAVDQWAADKPDYPQLEASIAEILKSGIIDRIHGEGLSVTQKLDAAYRMAGGNPVVHSDPVEDAPAPVDNHPAKPDAGKLSIAGSPSGGKSPTVARKQKSRRESIEAALAKISAS